jgi:phosphoglycolate phosphatase-like HAD superfamily hydrolase
MNFAKAAIDLNRYSPVRSSLRNHTQHQFSTLRNNGYILYAIVLTQNLDPANVLMVGDGLHDMLAGNGAGAVTCLLKHDWNANALDQADFIIDTLKEVEDIVMEHSQ